MEGEVPEEAEAVWAAAGEGDQPKSEGQFGGAEAAEKTHHLHLLRPQKEVVRTKTRISFVLLSAPWSVLCYYAEELSLKVPLQVGQ